MKNQILTVMLLGLMILTLASVSAIYYVNEPTAAGAPGYWVCDSVYQNCEFGVVHDCPCGTINCDRVNTCESVQSGKVSDTGLVGPAGYSFFLTNGYCQSGFQYNSVGGQSNNCAPIVPVVAPTVSITSPLNITYTNNTLTLSTSSNQVISNWKYNLNGAGNITFTNPTTINALNGSNFLVVYGTNVNGTGMASVNFFVNITSGNNQTNQTNQTNSTGTLPVITVLSPVNGWIYNITSILLNATANQPIISWTYSLNGASNLTFVPGTIYTLPLINGTNSIWIYGTNANGTGMTNVNFVYNSSFNGTNPGCTASVSCGSWSSCKNGEKIRTCTSISTSCASSVYDESKKCSTSLICINNSIQDALTTDLSSDVLPLTNSTINLTAKKATTSGFSVFLYWFIIAILILLIAIILVYILRFI